MSVNDDDSVSDRKAIIEHILIGLTAKQNLLLHFIV